MKHKQSQFGDIGEDTAKRYLIDIGFNILALKYAKPYGEIDIVAKKDRNLHFIEVKTSRYFPDTAFLPEVRVNKRKISNIKKICETYLREVKAPDDQRWQIDVFSVILNADNTVKELNLIENAVFEKRY